jgi:hypothetical protein
MLGYLAGVAINGVLYLFAKQANVDAVSVFYTPLSLAIITGVFSITVGFLTGIFPARRPWRSSHSMLCATSKLSSLDINCDVWVRLTESF